MTSPAQLAVRIAAAQLTGLSADRRVVPAGPFTGLLVVDGPEFLSCAVAARPGEPVTELGSCLDVLRPEFAPGPVRFELVDEACPGAAEALVAAGATVSARVPLMTVDPESVSAPAVPPGVRVEFVRTAEDHGAATAVANVAFGVQLDQPARTPPPPEEGGSVLARLHGTPVAVASWTRIADEVGEVVGVAVLPGHRRTGLGALITAHATVAAGLAGARLAWLTPGDDGAARLYESVGYRTTATAVHLAAE
ncbi:GNAT family N-acetyltransferase [Umezawaea beigongshangensis]|uniref:GNAT family N-acetyltransferase n=1 Tax=Umezawaea beigongshangensis TaxID=2780383 RepID=UPI0018F196FF|nr:GNAT family N-acetyltransferase [Umezawaea beigongshangensis]